MRLQAVVNKGMEVEPVERLPIKVHKEKEKADDEYLEMYVGVLKNALD